MGMKRGLGTLRVPPLNLNSQRLDALVQALGPAYLRVGGSEADKIHYFEAPPEEKDSLVLTKETWDDLHQFIQRNNLKFSFTIKYGLFKRKLHGGWCGNEVEKLLRYSMEKGYKIDVCELGNELNAYWAFHGLTSQPRAKNLAHDYNTFSTVIAQFLPDAQIIGPGSAFWPKLGETIKPFSNITRKFLEHSKELNTPLHIIDWHYYPFQSQRSPVRTRRATLKSLLKPKALNDFEKYAHHLKKLKDEFFPNAVMWTGETGSAQCGGQPKLSDRFASCFWWADQLGTGALCGQQVMIRQSLIAGEYGLVDRLTLKPRPDFWLSWIWNKLMGTDVYQVKHSHHMLRCYCHNTPNQNTFTLMLINLSAKPIPVNEFSSRSIQAQFCLTGKKLNSKKLLINDKKPSFRKGKVKLKDFAREQLYFTLPSYSINFWVIEDPFL